MRINLTAHVVKGSCAPSIGERLKSGTLSKSDGIKEREREREREREGGGVDALKYQLKGSMRRRQSRAN
jgi:hypothetical protein